MSEKKVIIIGGGPVGCCLALDLLRRNIKCCIVEKDFHGLTNPRCNTVSSRTMEYFRHLGIATRIRKAGYPPDKAADIVYCTSWAGFELARFKGRRSIDVLLQNNDVQTFDSHWPTLEPQHRISQMSLVPILRDRLLELNCEIFDGWSIEDFNQTSSGVVCSITKNCERKTLHGSYLVGCDGAHSVVRHKLGIKLQGQSVVTKFCSTFFRSEDLIEKRGFNPSWMTRVENKNVSSIIFSINGKDLWLVHTDIGPNGNASSFDYKWAINSAFNCAFSYEVIENRAWTARAVVAETYSQGNVFLCGDAAHLWIPLGGFGMNAGIADALNLSWKLWAVLSGWGGKYLLSSYEAERKPIGQQVAKVAAGMRDKFFEIPVHSSEYEEQSSSGAALRLKIGERILEQNGFEFQSGGIQLSIPYLNSPVIAYSGKELNREISIENIVESVEAGFRPPHLLLGDISLFDKFGDGFTLLCFGKDSDAHEALFVFLSSRVPLSVVNVPESPKYRRQRYVLVRPDLVTAWVGDHFDLRAAAAVLNIVIGNQAQARL